MNIDGPLPIVDAGSILQQESIRALQATLSPSEYRFRDERVDDFGVDGSIELLVDGRATNIRAQVQLKGRSGLKPTQTGGLSVQIRTSNVNYLLNGICPIYILFTPETKALRYVFARDEWRRLEQVNPAWKQQKTVAIQFREMFDGAALHVLKQRIAEETILRRRVDERVRILRGSDASIVVDPNDLQVSDTQELLAALCSIGQTMTNSGLARVVIDRAGHIPQKQLLAQPDAALAVAYAHFHLGHYHDASASLRSLLLTKPAVSSTSKSLMDVLFISTRRMLGEIDEEKYELELASWRGKAPPDLAVQQEIGEAWASLLSVSQKGLPGEEFEEARTKLVAVFQKGRQLGGQLLLLTIELQELTLEARDVADALIDSEALEDIGALGGADAHYTRVHRRKAVDVAVQWMERLKALAERARVVAPQVYCEALLLRTHAVLGQAMPRHFASLLGFGAPLTEQEQAKILLGVDETLSLARSLEHREHELSAMLYRAKALDLFGQDADATSLATEALQIAELSGCNVQAKQLEGFLRGGDRAADRFREMRAASSRSPEETIRQAGDDELRFYASLVVDGNQLPASRTPNVLRSLQCQRQLAIERRDWCRHIALAEFTETSTVLLFAKPPLHRIVCTKFQYEADVGAVNVDEVSLAFRQQFCERCSERSPGD